MFRKIGIFLILTAWIGFLYLVWELVGISFRLSFPVETAPPSIEERVSMISLDILKTFIPLFITLLGLQYLAFKYLIKESKIGKRLVLQFILAIGTSSMIYGYHVSVYVTSEQKKNTPKQSSNLYRYQLVERLPVKLKGSLVKS
jgi:hypothetical protein